MNVTSRLGPWVPNGNVWARCVRTVIAQFEVRVGLKVYRLSYVSDSSVKLESKAKVCNVESFESTVAFLRNKTKCLGIGVVYVEEVEKKSQSFLFTAFQASKRVQNEERPG